jgi:hypothetical protein
MTPTTNSSRSTTIVLAIIALLLFLVAYLLGTSHNASAGAATAAVSPPNSTSITPAGITVSGTGKVSGTPDTLRVDIGVSVHGSTVKGALDSANSAASAVQKSLRDSGVLVKDLQTTGLSVQPDYSASKDGRPDGYLVTESVSAVVRDLDKAGDAISAAASAGGDAVRISSISLDLENTGALIADARTRAFADAKIKAEQYARAAGRSVGAVVSIDETVAGPIPQVYDGRMAAQSLSSVPIQAGSQDVSVSVSVVFALD